MRDVGYHLLSELLDFAELISPDDVADGYSIYHIEFPKKGIGFSVSAKKVSGNVATPFWVVRTFSNYNV